MAILLFYYFNLRYLIEGSTQKHLISLKLSIICIFFITNLIVYEQPDF